MRQALLLLAAVSLLPGSEAGPLPLDRGLAHRVLRRGMALPARRPVRRRAEELRRLRVARARPAARLEHREPAGPGRRETLRAVRQGEERRPGFDGLGGRRHRLVPQALPPAGAGGRPPRRGALRRRLHEERRLAQREADRSRALRLHDLRLRPDAVPEPRRRERARDPRAQRGEEQPLVLGLWHLPPRLAHHHGTAQDAAVGRRDHDTGGDVRISHREPGRRARERDRRGGRRARPRAAPLSGRNARGLGRGRGRGRRSRPRGREHPGEGGEPAPVEPGIAVALPGAGRGGAGRGRRGSRGGDVRHPRGSRSTRNGACASTASRTR